MAHGLLRTPRMNGGAAEREHRPVLVAAVVEGLNIVPHGVYLDGTFGRGGHTQAVLQRLGSDGRVLALDKDPQAVVAAARLAAADDRLTFEHASFATLREQARRHGVDGKVNGVLLDLGVSSPQLDAAERGFSFLQEGPLDMRMNTSSGPTAAQWLAQADESEITRVLHEYGEERFARRIARRIIGERAAQPIETTRRLAEIIERAVPTRERGKHPATRSFQAIRIFINQELEELRAALEQSVEILADKGRLVVISFHSLEDRIVKRFMRDKARGEALPRDLPIAAQHFTPLLRLVGRAVRPSAEEVAENPRARSAVLRVAERIRA